MTRPQYRLLTKEYVQDRRMRRTPHSQGRSQRYRTAGPRSRIRDVSFYLRAGPSGATPPHSGGSGSFRQRQIRGLHHAAQPDGRRRRRTADLPGHRHGHLHRQEGRERLYGSGRRRMYRPGRLRSLQGAQPALFAGGALHDDRGEELGHEPARTDRSSTPTTKATNTNSCSSPKAAARPTKPSSTSRPKRC